MGVDVNLYAVGAVSDEELEAANLFARRRGVHGWDEGDPPFERAHGIPDRIEWSTLSRYYGVGYERGHWPNIHNAIACMRAALPRSVVHYGTDSFDDAPAVTDEGVDELWSHWLGPEGLGYRDR